MKPLCLRVRLQEQLARLVGIDVESVEQSTTVSRVPGSRFDMALVRGQIIPVLRLGSAEGCIVVGRVRGEVFGIAGLDIVEFDWEEPRDEEPIATCDSRPVRADDSQELPNGEVGRSRVESELHVDEMIDRAKLQQCQPPQVSEELR